MTIAVEVRSLVRCLLGKRSELEALDLSDVMMAKAILDIHRNKIRKDVVRVPLFSLHLIHMLDRDNAIAATRTRMSAAAPRDRRHATSENCCGSMPRRGATLSGLAR